jgi:peptide/nickel transport system substrate-binding protein
VAVWGALVTTRTAAPPRPDYREALVASHRPAFLNPLASIDDPIARDLGRLLYRHLLRLDSHSLPVLDLAGSWGITGDGLAYRFTVGAGLLWSDGSPITVDDVVASISVVQAPDFLDAGLAAAFKGVTAVVDKETLTLNLPAPRASFAVALTDLPILPAAVLRGHTVAELARTGTSPLPTSGSYRVSDADAMVLHMQPNPHAVLPPKMHLLEFRLVASADEAQRLFASHEVDAVAPATPQQRQSLSRVPGAHLHDMLSFRFVDLLFNVRTPGLEDPVVRHAIALAVDRAAIVRDALGGAGRVQVDAIPMGVLWIGNRPAEQPDAQLSARALDAAGWLPGDGGVRRKGSVHLELSLDVPDVDPFPAVGRELAKQLDALGISLAVRPVAPQRFERDVLLPHAFQLAVADWDNGADPDISSYWRSNATPPNGVNVSGLPMDPFLDRALDALATENDTAVRRAAAEKAAARVADGVPAVFLYAPLVSLSVSDALGNVRLPPTGRSGDRYAMISGWSRNAPAP